MFGKIGEFFGFNPEEPEETSKLETEKEITPEQLAFCINKFIAGYRLKVGVEFIDSIMQQVNFSKEDLNDIMAAVNNQTPDNGLSISANIANLNYLRSKLIDVIKKMDVAQVVE